MGREKFFLSVFVAIDPIYSAGMLDNAGFRSNREWTVQFHSDDRHKE